MVRRLPLMPVLDGLHTQRTVLRFVTNRRILFCMAKKIQKNLRISIIFCNFAR